MFIIMAIVVKEGELKNIYVICKCIEVVNVAPTAKECQTTHTPPLFSVSYCAYSYDAPITASTSVGRDSVVHR